MPKTITIPDTTWRILEAEILENYPNSHIDNLADVYVILGGLVMNAFDDASLASIKSHADFFKKSLIAPNAASASTPAAPVKAKRAVMISEEGFAYLQMLLPTDNVDDFGELLLSFGVMMFMQCHDQEKIDALNLRMQEMRKAMTVADKQNVAEEGHSE